MEAPVVSSDGADLGKIDKIVFDPQSGETKCIVVRKGKLLPRDVAVPTDRIRVAAPTRVELDMTRQELEGLPDFFESDYSWPPDGWMAPYGWPAGSVMWPSYVGAFPADYPAPYVAPVNVSPEVMEQQRQRAKENAVISEGADVVAMDGQKVGSVRNMMIDPASHKPSRVVVQRGVLFTQDVELPGDWVGSVDEERVVLTVDKVTVEQLAKHQNT